MQRCCVPREDTDVTPPGARSFAPRRSIVQRLRKHFVTRAEFTDLANRLESVRESADALSERLDQLEELIVTRSELDDVQREVAVVRTGLRAVTNAVSTLSEDHARET